MLVSCHSHALTFALLHVFKVDWADRKGQSLQSERAIMLYPAEEVERRGERDLLNASEPSRYERG